MTQVDISNRDLLRNVDPIRKAVYDEEGTAKFHIGHLHEAPPVDLFGWAEKERGKKATYELVGEDDVSPDNWELDVRPLISSTRWLQVHGLKRNRLTMTQILSAIGFKHSEDYVQTLGRPVGSYYGHGLFQQFKRKDGQLYNITVGREKLQKIEESLLRASHLYKRRMQWLTTGSRRIFGVIQEHCICFVLDVSTMSQSQFDLYRESLCETIRDQVSQLAKFNMIKAQADMQMWQEQAMPVTEVTIRNAIEWVNKLDRMAETSRTGCTEAVLKAMEDDSLEAVYLFAEGDSSELSKELLRQKLVDAPHVLHTVSFNATKTGTVKFLKEVSEQTKGRFHAFVVKNMYEEDAEALPASAAPPGGDASRISVRYGQKARGGLPAGSGVRDDVFKVWCELEECRNNHAQVQTLLTEIPDPKTDSTAIEKASLISGKRVEQYMSSKEWLERHGLEARKLTAYQELANCSFRHVDGVVDLKGKPGPNNQFSDAENMRKLVNAKYCEQFAHTEWKDGTLVHVHITAEQHKVYEKRMGTALDAIQKRIDWLQQGSREVFGTILEEQVYILIDTSLSMKDKLALVKEKLFQLMQEQLRHKNKFNIIRFDTKAVAWKDRACDVTEQHLLNAWNWVKDIGVGGSTNTLAALRIALSDPHTHAIYLLTDGRPDQSPYMIFKFLQQPRSVLAQVQLQHPVPIHTIAFNCNDLEANKFLHQLSADTGGRYHYFTSNGSLPDGPPPFESEDVSLLKQELERGRQDLEKVSKLRARCVMLDWYHNKQHGKGSKHSISSSPSNSKLAITYESRPRLTRPKRPQSALVRRSHSTSSSSDNSFERPNTSLGHYRHQSYDNLASAHKGHRGVAGVNDAIISKKKGKRKSTVKGHQRIAGHTRTSMLRLDGESHGWMLPETENFMNRQIEKSLEAYKDIVREKMEKKRKPIKKKKAPTTNSLDIPNAIWLKKNSLAARKLTVMDVLTPTVVKVKPKYIPILNAHVVSKVFNDVLPIAHVSPRDRRNIRLVNPAAVDLPGYDRRLTMAIEQLHQRLNLQVWRSLSEEEREKFEAGPVSYMDNKDALDQAFDRLGWPLAQEEIQLLVNEIQSGERYLQQSQDLQQSAKKVAMGRKKEDDDAQSSSSSDLSQSSDEDSEISEKSEEIPRRHAKTRGKKKHLDRFKGLKVIARDEIDGFYYSGYVLKSTDARHALVLFKYGEEKIIPTRFVIPRSGAVSCPPLSIGDRVLAYNNRESNVGCYIPAIVIDSPRKSQGETRFFTVLNYNNTKSYLQRRKLIKISETRYAFAVRYIKRASHIDSTIPSVDFVPAQPPREPGYVDEIRGALKEIEENLDENKQEQKELRKTLNDYLNDNEQQKRDLEQCKEDKDDYKKKLEASLKRDVSLNTDPMIRDISTNTDTLQLDPVTPTTDSTTITNVSPIADDDKDRTVIAVDETADAATITRGSTGVHVGRSEPVLISRSDALTRELSSKPELNQEVLARCADDGWYYRGSVKAIRSGDLYEVLDYTGLIQNTLREDIITDKDDADSIIKEGTTVVALHPHFPLSYAPGKIVQCKPNEWFRVRFYDKEEANVQRLEVYKIPDDKYTRDVAYIVAKEEQWVGEAVVARNDVDGQYQLASCRKRIGNGHQYELQWSDGTLTAQHLSCIFGAHTKRRQINVGDCVLALSDERQLIYLPGRVMQISDEMLQVNFCNRARIGLVNPAKCFWISRHYHDLAVAFYNSKQPVAAATSRADQRY